ncbi:unnamed protein product [Sphenostylis stenocarpa]|uniref:CRAL-TRIO domain-containing protein n=1 Tax=Sphenostylis stenocarpa TaxID=92480 RepID=A0AA86S8H4_9FABA|nr:unnamed protein product [Sphenostylis stenocarpa]
MASASLPSFIQMSSTHSTFTEKLTTPQKKFQIGIPTRHTHSISWPFPSPPSCKALQKSVPLAASLAILLWSAPANAGFMSGISGLEAVPGPQLPQIDFLKNLNDENQKKYAENDERIKSSPLLKKLLEQSKLNKEKNRKEIENKYCIRGAEWGVGDCSAEGMSPEERDKFIAMLKQKAGQEPVASSDSATSSGGLPNDSGDSVVTLDQVPRWIDAEHSLGYDNGDSSFSSSHYPDPLTFKSGTESGGSDSVSRFPVDQEVNSKIYLWRGNPWNLEVDAVVNSTNEVLDEAHSSPGLHAAAGPGLAEECATLAKNYPREPAAHVAIRTVRRFLEKQKDNITAVVFCTTSTVDTEIYKRLLPLYFPRDKQEELMALARLPADVGDENGETVIDERKIRIKPLPKKIVSEPAKAPVDLPVSDVGSVRRTSSYLDTFLDPAFMSLIKDPDERRLEQWEKTVQAQRGWNFANLLGFGDLGGAPLSAAEEYSLHSRYLSKAKSLNLSEIAEMKIVFENAKSPREGELWKDEIGIDLEKQREVANRLIVEIRLLVKTVFGDGCIKKDGKNKEQQAELRVLMFFSYRGGVDSEGRPVMVVVGAHFLLRCLDLERFVLYVVKEFEPIIQKPYTIVYFHSAASLQVLCSFVKSGFFLAIYVLHSTVGLKLTVFALQLLVDNTVWKKVVYVDRLLQLFRYVPREQLTIPDFVFQLSLYVFMLLSTYLEKAKASDRHDLEVNGGKGLIVDPRTKYVYHRP